MAFLDEAIAILEQADGMSQARRETAGGESGALMDDLGHSMTPFYLAPMRPTDAFAAAGAGWRSVSVEESLRFFE